MSQPLLETVVERARRYLALEGYDGPHEETENEACLRGLISELEARTQERDELRRHARVDDIAFDSANRGLVDAEMELAVLRSVCQALAISIDIRISGHQDGDIAVNVSVLREWRDVLAEQLDRLSREAPDAEAPPQDQG